MIKEDVKASGTLTIVKNGVVVRQEENLVVSTGLSHMSSRLLSAADAVISICKSLWMTLWSCKTMQVFISVK